MSSKEHTKRGRKMEGKEPKEVTGWKTKNKKQLVSRIYLYKKDKNNFKQKRETKNIPKIWMTNNKKNL
jgi:hypothetical protein